MLVEMQFTLNRYIDGIPQGKDAAWRAATRNDDITVKSWAKQWLDQTIANSSSHDISGNSAMAVHGAYAGKPVILMGAGPSLQKNWMFLKEDREKKIQGRCDIPIVTSVHNFPFCEDRDLMTSSDFYVILDAGEICISEMSEGGSHNEEWYWERTKDRVLIAYHGAHPEFIKKWQGQIYWYSTPSASAEFASQIGNIIDLSKVPVFNVGGNVMGASLYFARAVLGCSVPIFIGMDLCFSYDRKFHPWDCKYNSMFGEVIPWTDIWGNRVWTWGSYFGFKNWFDFMACGGSGGNAQIWINATEGGILGAYQEGCIRQIIQLDLKTALHIFNMHKILPELISKSKNSEVHLLF